MLGKGTLKMNNSLCSPGAYSLWHQECRSSRRSHWGMLRPRSRERMNSSKGGGLSGGECPHWFSGHSAFLQNAAEGVKLGLDCLEDTEGREHSRLRQCLRGNAKESLWWEQSIQKSNGLWKLKKQGTSWLEQVGWLMTYDSENPLMN